MVACLGIALDDNDALKIQSHEIIFKVAQGKIMSQPAPCIPPALPVTNLDWRRLLPLAGKANAALARYDGMLQALPNPAVQFSPIAANEAVLSSRIEGTQATLEEVLQQDAGIEQAQSRPADIEEISNYRAAMRDAEQALAHRPLSLSLIKGGHQRLMQGVRGSDKTPGEFRIDQNWIGSSGSRVEQARFISPNPLVLPHAPDVWASYLAAEDAGPVLQVAIAHAQFDILHPFKDGNGRIGRMLIPLLLFQRKTLSRPMFYLSEYLESHRDQYNAIALSATNFALHKFISVKSKLHSAHAPGQTKNMIYQNYCNVVAEMREDAKQLATWKMRKSQP